MKGTNLTGMSWKQLLRTPLKLVLYFALPALVGAFLCLGLNLYQYASANLSAVYTAFSVTAIPDFKGTINSDGELYGRSINDDLIGYYACEAENYDITPLTQLEGVIDYDVRNQFGAYIANASSALARASIRNSGNDGMSSTVISFVLAGNETFTIPKSEKVNIPAYVNWAAGNDSDASPSVQRSLTVHNITEQEYTLEPATEYIMILTDQTLGWELYHLAEYPIPQFYVGKDGTYCTQKCGMWPTAFAPIAENHDGFWQTEMGDYYRQIAEAAEYTAYSLTAVTVNRLDGIEAFSENRVWVSEGREFTEEEIASGAKVCLVSAAMAQEMGWALGDMLNMSFYPCRYLYTAGDYMQHSSCRQEAIESSPIYQPNEAIYPSAYHDFPSMHIFDQGEYEIVGIYDGMVGFGRESSGNHKNFYENTDGKGVYFMNVYIPSNSVANQPTPKLSENNTTLWINPKKLLDFQAALESSGLTAKQDTGYTMNVTVYDHNLSQLAPGLESLSQISKLILVLSGLTALLTVVAFAVLYTVQNKRQIAAFRAIGMSKRQVAVLLLFAVLLVCILGAGAGAFAGQKISASVTQSILETAAENRSDPSFSATLADADEEAEAFTYLEQENPLFPIFTWAGISLTLIIAMLICFANESKKSPMLLLGTKE